MVTKMPSKYDKMIHRPRGNRPSARSSLTIQKELEEAKKLEEADKKEPVIVLKDEGAEVQLRDKAKTDLFDLFCSICVQSFKTEAAAKRHETSKKHKKNLEMVHEK